ncbi:hypothetical protein D9615_003315 [Tricholomella constricta]|uniref:Uncharacterized protein n=1 Tax=Tricholomella constricta TaxID=117010 RepID=A0A8H5M8A8_9AGAR|nr:hypothetical protein D9615_003315 [Tricholomella constricta]
MSRSFSFSLRLPPREASVGMEERYLKLEDNRRSAFTRQMYEQQQEFAAEEKAQSEGEDARVAEFGRTLVAFDAEFERNEDRWDRAYAEADARQEDTFQKNEAIRETTFLEGQGRRNTTFRDSEAVWAKRSESYAAVRQRRFLEGRQARKDVCNELETALKEQFKDLLEKQQALSAAEERRRDNLVNPIPATASSVSSLGTLDEVQSTSTPFDAGTSKKKLSKTPTASSQGIYWTISNPSTTSNKHAAGPGYERRSAIIPPYAGTSCEEKLSDSSSASSPQMIHLTIPNNEHAAWPEQGRPRQYSSHSSSIKNTSQKDNSVALQSSGVTVFSERRSGAVSDALHQPESTMPLISSASTAASSGYSGHVLDAVSNKPSSNKRPDEPSPHDVPMSKSSQQSSMVVLLEQDSDGINDIPPSFLHSVRRAASRLISQSSRSGQGIDNSHARSSSNAAAVTKLDERFRSSQEQRQRSFSSEEETREIRFTAAEATLDAAESERDKAYDQGRRVRDMKIRLKETAYQQEYFGQEITRNGRNVVRRRRFEADQSHRALTFEQSLSRVEKQALGDNALEDGISDIMKITIERLNKKQRRMLEAAREHTDARFRVVMHFDTSYEFYATMSNSSSAAVERERPSLTAGFVPAAIFRGANPQDPLPIPSLDAYDYRTKTLNDLYNRGSKTSNSTQRRQQHLFKKLQTENALAFESGIERRQHFFLLNEQRRQFEFEKKQVERNDEFGKDKNAYEIKFREGQNEREKAFHDAEAARQSSFSDSEVSRDVIFGSSMKDMDERFYSLQDSLQKTCFEVEDRRLIDLEAWGSEMLQRRAKEEEDSYQSQKARLENFYQTRRENLETKKQMAELFDAWKAEHAVAASLAEIEERSLKLEDHRQLVFTRQMYEQQQVFAAEEKAQLEGEAARAAEFSRTLVAFNAEFERNEDLWDRSYAEADARQEDTFQKNEVIWETTFLEGQGRRNTTFRGNEAVWAKRSEWYAAKRQTRFLEGRQARKDVCDELETALKEQNRDHLEKQQDIFAAEDSRRKDELLINSTPTTASKDISSVSNIGTSVQSDAGTFKDQLSETPLASLPEEIHSTITNPSTTSNEQAARPAQVQSILTVADAGTSSKEKLSVTLLASLPQGIHSTISNPSTTNEHAARPVGQVQSILTVPDAGSTSSKEKLRKTPLASSAQGIHSTITNPMTTSNEHAAIKVTSQKDDSGKNIPLVLKYPASMLFFSSGDFFPATPRAVSDALHQPESTMSLSSSASTVALSRFSGHVLDAVSNDPPSNKKPDEPSAHDVSISQSSQGSAMAVHLEQDSNDINVTPPSFLHSFRRAASRLIASSWFSGHVLDAVSNEPPSNKKPDEPSAHDVSIAQSSQQSPIAVNLEQDSNGINVTPPSFLHSFRRAASRLLSHSSRRSLDVNHSDARSSNLASLVAIYEERFRSGQEQRQRAFSSKEKTRETHFKAAEATHDAAESERDKAYNQGRRVREMKFRLKETTYQQAYSGRELTWNGRNHVRQQRFNVDQRYRASTFHRLLSRMEMQALGDDTSEDEIFDMMKSNVERLIQKQERMLGAARERFDARFIAADRTFNGVVPDGVVSRKISLAVPESPPMPLHSRPEALGQGYQSLLAGSASARPSVHKSLSAGFGANPQDPLPIPSFRVYNDGTKAPENPRRWRQHLFEKSQTERELAFESGIERRRHLFLLNEQKRQLKFEKKQVERNKEFGEDKDAYEIKFREGQNKREKVFLDAEAARQSSIKVFEASRDAAFDFSMKDMDDRFYAMQNRLQKTCFEAEDRRLSDLEAWSSEVLQRTKF